MHCQLMVPDLFWPDRDLGEIYGKLHTPALERLLAKGRRRHAPAASAEVWLCEQFGVERQQDWPIAPYCLLADGGEPGGHYWLRADPVHIELEGNQLVLAASGAIAISRQEAVSLTDSFNAHFSADGLAFCPLQPDRWYLRTETAPALETTELAAAEGRSIDTLLPRGGDAKIWRTRLNDLQMLLHGHAVNQARENAGQPSINGVWIWGGGTASGAVSAPFGALWSRDPFACGLARAAHIAAHTLTEDAADWLRASASEGVTLIVLDQLRGAARQGDAHSWCEALQRMERDWIAPLLAALAQDRIGMLSLHALGPEGELAAEVTRGDLRRFWRRVRPLGAYVRGLT